METISTSIEPSVVPRTANLLACKQWWRVCFLYGDQQKYYRQVYGKAAAQRLAATKQTVATKDNENDNLNTTKSRSSSTTDRDYDTITDFIETQLGELPAAAYPNNDDNTTSQHNNKNTNNNNNNYNNSNNNHVTAEELKLLQQQCRVPLFPAKYQSTSSNNTASMTMRKSKKILRSLRKHDHNTSHGNGINKSNNNNKDRQKSRDSLEVTKTHTQRSHVTVLDDPFLFGIDEDHLGDLIRPKQYAINATDDISKYFGYYVDQQQQQQKQFEQDKTTLQDYQDDPIRSEEPAESNNAKPALPPKKMARPIDISTDLQLNQSDLEFLNLNLRKRGCFPRDELQQLDKTQPHDISFTFNEDPASLDSETSSKQQSTENEIDNENDE